MLPGGGNSNPLQCSRLENPKDREAWWTTVSGVAESRMWLRLSIAQIMLPWTWGADLFLRYWFCFLQINTQNWDCWIIWQFHFWFFEASPYCFHCGCTHFPSHQRLRRHLDSSLDSNAGSTEPHSSTWHGITCFSNISAHHPEQVHQDSPLLIGVF